MAPLVCAQQAASRTEQMEQIRTDKQSRLWPEHTPGLVTRLNKYTERGLLEGVRSGEGTNGPQIILGGMRSGYGISLGVGYRRIDLWNERLAFRVTARGTPRLAYMFDLQLESPRLNSGRVDLKLYSKYENSPQIDYFGPGPDSAKSNRSSFRLEDVEVNLEGRIRVWRKFYAGAVGGVYVANTGKGKRSGFPSTDEIFDPAQTPGLWRRVFDDVSEEQFPEAELLERLPPPPEEITPLPPSRPMGADIPELSDAAQEFLTDWLVHQKYDEAMEFVSDESLPCLLLSSESTIKMQRGRPCERSLKSRASVWVSISRSVRLSQPQTAWGPNIRKLDHQYSREFDLVEVTDSIAESFLCRNRKGRFQSGQRTKWAFGNYYGTLFRFRIRNADEDALALLWKKESGHWRIQSYDVVAK